jgi:hypothetical protein
LFEDLDPDDLDPVDFDDALVELPLLEVVDLFASVLPDEEEDLDSPFDPSFLVGITKFVIIIYLICVS